MPKRSQQRSHGGRNARRAYDDDMMYGHREKTGGHAAGHTWPLGRHFAFGARDTDAR